MEFSHLQSQILKSGAEWVKADGKIYYSTCTVDYLENEEVVDSFLKVNGEKYELAEIPEKYK